MTVTPFKAVEFKKHDIVTKDSLDQLQSNYQWMQDNTPRARFVRINGKTLDAFTVMIAGRVMFPKNKKTDTAMQRVNIVSGFAPNCNPVVTTGVISAKQPRVHCVVTGFKNNLHPKNNGFIVRINIDADLKKNDHIADRIWVHWHALGFRENNMPVWTGGK